MVNNVKIRNQSGFTLIELLIVVAILGLLAAIGIPQYQGYQAQAKLNATKTLHSEAVKLIGAELAKCTSGATNILESSSQQSACSGAVDTLTTQFTAYFNAKNKNPYDVTVSPFNAACSGTPADGVTCLAADTTANTITVTTYWLGGNQADTLKKE